MTFQSFLPFTPQTSNTFTLTTTELIKQALAEIRIGIDGEDVYPEYYARALTQLNLVLAEIEAQGLHIATYRVGTLFLNPNQNKYTLEQSNFTNQYYSTTLTANAATNATTLTVNSVSSISVGDYIGITLDSGALYWTTVSSKNTGASTVTIPATGLPSSSTSGNYIFNYTTTGQQVIRIHQCWRTDNYFNDIPIVQISKQEYDALPYKTSNVATGLANQIYYERSIPYGTLYVWPPAQDSRSFLNFWYETRLGMMKNATDVVALDQTYLPAIVKWTAYRMCNSFGSSDAIYQRVKMEANELMDLALSFDAEATPFKVALSREQ
jgi:hypothetical protein